MQSIAASGMLLDQPDLIENIQVWISAMSSATNRPFRHTSTLIALEVISALAALGRSFADNRAKAVRQSEGEKNNKRINQARIDDLQSRADEASERSRQVDSIINDWFDTVFIHRYRDVDPRIRVDCVTYLSDWVAIYPEHFLDGSHLRYLGWLLSDVSGLTRMEVLKQMQKIFRDDSKIGSLRQFTERFRPRMVEIATRDAESNCRISAVELLDIMRDKGLLEPNDIDTLGKLMFDQEPRVRKTFVPFFVASVEDSYLAKVEDLGEEVLEEILPNEDDLETPRMEWLHFKSLVELMQLYESEDDSKVLDIDPSMVKDVPSASDSRCSLAAQAVFEKMPVLKNWELLAGYLLADHSSVSDEPVEDLEIQLRQACKPGEMEEVILLDVLNASVKLCLTEVVEEGGAKKTKKTKAQLQELHEKQEAAAQRLAAMIPRLLNKFGASPEAASVVLRLERVLNLDVFQELRQDSTTYSSLLEDINRQFLTHEDQSVISEARAALLHAKSFEELGEVTEGKLQSLWDDTTLTLARLSRAEELSIRGNLHISVVRALSSTTLRISNLASISNCTEALDKALTLKSSNPRRRQTESTPIQPLQNLLDIVGRGVLVEGLEDDLGEAEDILVSHASKSLFFHFMWHARYLKSPSVLEFGTVSTVLNKLNEFNYRLRNVLSSRHGADPLRVSTAGTLLDLHTVVSTLRPAENTKGGEVDQDPLSDIFSAASISDDVQRGIFKVFAAAEREYASRAGRTLEKHAPEVDDDPESSEDEDAEPEDDDEEGGESAEPSENHQPVGENGEEDDQEAREARMRTRADRKNETKLRKTMIAEQALCGLASRMVMAVFAKVLDAEAVKDRLVRNKRRLGQNYKGVVTALEKGPGGPSAAAGAKRAAKGKKAATSQVNGTSAKGRKSSKGKEVVEEEDEDEPEVEEDGEEDLRRRELLLEDDQNDEGHGEDEAEDAADSVDGGGEESVLGD